MSIENSERSLCGKVSKENSCCLSDCCWDTRSAHHFPSVSPTPSPLTVPLWRCLSDKWLRFIPEGSKPLSLWPSQSMGLTIQVGKDGISILHSATQVPPEFPVTHILYQWHPGFLRINIDIRKLIVLTPLTQSFILSHYTWQSCSVPVKIIKHATSTPEYDPITVFKTPIPNENKRSGPGILFNRTAFAFLLSWHNELEGTGQQ